MLKSTTRAGWTKVARTFALAASFALLCSAAVAQVSATGEKNMGENTGDSLPTPTLPTLI